MKIWLQWVVVLHSDEDFTAIILNSFTALYDAHLFVITATVSVMITALNPEALMVSIIDEYDRRTVKKIRTRQTIEILHFMQDTHLKVPKGATEGQRKY